MTAASKDDSHRTPTALALISAQRQLGIRSQDLADLVGYSDSYIRQMENGRHVTQPFIDGCASRAKQATGDTKEVLEPMVAELQAIRDEESARIDPNRGAEKRRKPRPLRGDVEEIAGEWSAIWQTSLHLEAAVLTETVVIAPARSPRGAFEIGNKTDGSWLEAASPDDEADPDHFLWEGSGTLFQRRLNGLFASASQPPYVSGVFHLALDDFRKAMTGYWIGVSSDSENTLGLLVLGRNEGLATRWFEAARDANPALPMLAEQHRNGSNSD